MPTISTPHPAKTLKQAKKAYQKSGAVPGLSETELKHLERAALLQERADRIKKREAQKLINRRKKLEKEQKEREARNRMGIPDPNKAYVSPRQERLSQFVRGDAKSRGQNEGHGTMTPSGSQEESDQRLEDLLVDQSCLVEREPSSRPLQPTTPNRGRLQGDQGSSCSLAGKTASTQPDDWAAFFVSNTQIERELTNDDLETPEKDSESAPAAREYTIQAEDKTAELLGYLATQDLDFDIDETEDIIPIEETLPMFPSDGAELSEDDFTDLKSKAKAGGSKTAEAEGLMPVLTTQNLGLTDDELEESAPREEFQWAEGHETMPERLESQHGALLRAQLRISGATEAPKTTAVELASKRPDPVIVSVNYDTEDFDFSSQDLLELEKPRDQKGSKSSSQAGTAEDFCAETFALEDFDLSEEDLQELTS
ncbi:MAG: hypothetical protein M1830_009595 [Pleopsidium flavum]|nr:MAG: hypothetical protein M1830_009595 [Pleopsidium flavum]